MAEPAGKRRRRGRVNQTEEEERFKVYEGYISHPNDLSETKRLDEGLIDQVVSTVI